MNARNRYYKPLNNKLKFDVNYIYAFGWILIISYMYEKDVKLIKNNNFFSFKIYFTYQIQEFVELKCKCIIIFFN